MPVKRSEYPSTGIYKRRISTVAIRADEEGMRELAELLPGGPQADPFGPDAMETAAKDFIKEYAQAEMGGFDETLPPGSMESLVQERINQQREQVAAELRNDLSKEQERRLIRKLGKIERAADACEMLSLIDGVRPYLQTQPHNQAMMGIVFLLGRAYERFRARAHEQVVLTGSKVSAALSAGGKARKGMVADEYQKIVSDFQRSGLSQRRFSQISKIPRTKLQRALRQAKKLDSHHSK